jgi:tetratricopeptide (TPR) repeat protein
VHTNKGDYDKALDYYDRSLAINEELGNNFGISHGLNNIGIMHYLKRDYDKMFSHLQKAVNIQKEIGTLELETVTLFALANKNLSKEYDEKEIHTLIKEAENIYFGLNLRLYELLEDISYLKTAYNQVQELANNLEPDVAAKFLSYPIPKAIVKEYNKVFKK